MNWLNSRRIFFPALAFTLSSVSCLSYGKFWDVSTSGSSAITVFAVADTGQTLCNSNGTGTGAFSACPQTVVGQDGDYVNKPNARSFTGPTQHGTYTTDYTTTDNVTKLVWKSCVEGRSDPSCGLSATQYTWATAAARCATLNTANASAGYAGRTDWRVPTARELETLANLGTNNPAIDIARFPLTDSGYYWTSEAIFNSPGDGWIVGFDEGDVRQGLQGDPYYVRCVSGTKAGAVVYTDKGDGTVKDESTGLVWQKCSNGLSSISCGGGPATTLTWSAAIAYCQALNLAGLTWRMPSKNELASIIDRSTAAPPINTAAFPATASGAYWSSSTQNTDVTTAWVGRFSDGWNTFGGGGKASLLYMRCVTGP